MDVSSEFFGVLRTVRMPPKTRVTLVRWPPAHNVRARISIHAFVLE
jgi:hypothetical protein